MRIKVLNAQTAVQSGLDGFFLKCRTKVHWRVSKPMAVYYCTNNKSLRQTTKLSNHCCYHCPNFFKTSLEKGTIKNVSPQTQHERDCRK